MRRRGQRQEHEGGGGDDNGDEDDDNNDSADDDDEPNFLQHQVLPSSALVALIPVSQSQHFVAGKLSLIHI